MNHLELKPLLRLFYLTTIALTGLACSSLFGNVDIVHSAAYAAIASSLLFAGLYLAVYGIDKDEAKRDWRVVLTAVTFGVLCKYLLIFGATFAVTRQWEYAILAMAVAQIDPLSIAAISSDKRMSKRTKTVLNAWASFDDPVTALVTPLLLVLSVQVGGIHVNSSPTAWLFPGIIGFVFALGIFAVAYRTRREAGKTLGLGALAVGVVCTKLYAAAAIAGWVVRSNWLQKGKRADYITNAALIGATFLLGILLAEGVDWRGGLVLGFATFFSQMVATVLVLRVAARIKRRGSTHQSFAKRDAWHLALAQQNGITAIVLALNLEPSVPNAVAVVSFAIVVINLLNFAANMFYDRVGHRAEPSRA